jgi:trk system potassium uptake protein TrkA
MRVLVAGAGNVGRYLAGILVKSGHQVTLIENDESRVERAREESSATVVLGDATEPSLLERNAIRTTDVVVAVTGDDEDNLVIASLAKFEFGVHHVVARVKNAANAWLYEPDMGVDTLVSAPHTIAQLIEEQVAVGDVVQLLELGRGEAALLEVTLPEDSPAVGCLAGEVVWPADCVLTAVLRESRVLAAASETLLAAGDRLLCVTDIAQIDALHRLLGTLPSAR